MPNTRKNPLKGLHILVPRPSPQGDNLVAEIRAQGGEAVHFPVLETAAPESFHDLDIALFQLEAYSLLIVVSVAAARAIATRASFLGISLPASVWVASVGPVTSDTLRKLGISVDFEPQSQFTSEGLLEVLQKIGLAGHRVALFRGQDGRETLTQELTRQGAYVDIVTCYQRKLTTASFCSIVEIWKSPGFDVVIITSNAILDALILLLGKQNLCLMHSTKALVISRRIADYCATLGICDVILSEPGNGPVINSLARLLTR